METMEKVTIRCFVLGMAFVLLWFVCCMSGDWDNIRLLGVLGGL